jgi:hypothetical protein
MPQLEYDEGFQNPFGDYTQPLPLEDDFKWDWKIDSTPNTDTSFSFSFSDSKE